MNTMGVQNQKSLDPCDVGPQAHEFARQPLIHTVTLPHESYHTLVRDNRFCKDIKLPIGIRTPNNKKSNGFTASHVHRVKDASRACLPCLLDSFVRLELRYGPMKSKEPRHCMTTAGVCSRELKRDT